MTLERDGALRAAYRVLYEIHDDAGEVLVIRVDHAAGIYRRR